MSEWISVKDRLPETLTEKLLYVEVKNNWSGGTNKIVTIGFYLRACNYEGWNFVDKDLDVIRVISWRDIPEPPKEDKLDQAYSDAVNDAQNYYNPRVAQDALQNAYDNVSRWIDKILNGGGEAKDEEIHSADAEPVKHGQWIYGENDDGQDGIFCSECEHFVPWFYEYYDKSDELIDDNPRCPNCGAKMDLKDGDIIDG